MRLVKPSIAMLDTNNPIKLIEQVGRTCYKSEDKIAEGSATAFVQKLIDRGHFAMIEFSNFVMEVSPQAFNWVAGVMDRSYIKLTMENRFVISGNARAFIELHLNNMGVFSALFLKTLKDEHEKLFKSIDIDLNTRAALLPLMSQAKLIDEDSLVGTEYFIHKCFGYKVICNRGVTHEIVRHRPFSYAQESTRYCNYKGGVTFIIPLQVLIQEEFIDTEIICHHGLLETTNNTNRYYPDVMNCHWLEHMQACEIAYQIAIARKWTPQQARGVLPIDVKTEINIYGNVKQWAHFFTLRCSPKAHPQMQEVANMIKQDLVTKGILDLDKEMNNVSTK